MPKFEQILRYEFIRDWDGDLKARAFVRAFHLRSGKDKQLALFQNSITISKGGVDIGYTTRSPFCLIKSMEVDIIIFDAGNPSAGFSYQSFSE